MSRPIVRPATAADLLAYAGRDMPEWCAAWAGYAAERDGVVIALGLVCWDGHGGLTGWFDARERLMPVTMHRTARKMLDLLRGIGEQRIAVYCDAGIDGAAMWLDRLGFKPDEVTEHGQVWRCCLA